MAEGYNGYLADTRKEVERTCAACENKNCNGMCEITKRINNFPGLMADVISEKKLFKHPMPEQDPVERAQNFERLLSDTLPKWQSKRQSVALTARIPAAVRAAPYPCAFLNS